MQPFQQGGLDSLCGIYSLVNAEKVINGTDTEKSQNLFNEIVTFLENEKILASILTGGMLLKNLKLILNEVIGERIPQKKLIFHARPNPSLGEFWKEVEMYLNETGRAVIISLSGVHEHWSTVQKISTKQIKLFDSDGLNHLNRASCTTAEPTSKRQHIIWPAQNYSCQNRAYRDREEPHSSPLPHHAAYGSVLRGSADQAESDPGEQRTK